MKKAFWGMTTVILLCFTMSLQAQTNLVGRIYQNSNILDQEMKEKMAELDKEIVEKKSEIYAEAEKKKGRKLTAAETAELDKQLKEGKEKAAAVMKAMKTSVSIEFKTANQAVMRLSMKIDDEALKAAGVGWVKRKALKAALALAPESSKEPYVVKGNSVIIGKGKDQETFTLSADGKYLTGKADDKNVTLTRIQ